MSSAEFLLKGPPTLENLIKFRPITLETSTWFLCTLQ